MEWEWERKDREGRKARRRGDRRMSCNHDRKRPCNVDCITRLMRQEEGKTDMPGDKGESQKKKQLRALTAKVKKGRGRDAETEVCTICK